MPESAEISERRTESADSGNMRAAPILLRLAIPPALLLLAALAFMPALQAAFVNWDDDDLVLLETRYRGFTEESVRFWFESSFSGHFQPLTWCTFAIDWAAWNSEPLGYHLTNVLLHLTSTLVFYFLARRLLRVGAGSLEAEAPLSRSVLLGAAAATFVFAVHPLRAESVAWIAERRDVLALVFYLLSTYAYVSYVRARRANQSVGRQLGWYSVVALMMVVSLLAKATAVMLPVCLLVLDAFPLGRFARADGSRLARLWRLGLEKTPLLMLSLIFGIRALIAQEEGGALTSLDTYGPTARVAQAAYGLVFYPWKTLAPVGLGPLYQVPHVGEVYRMGLAAGVALLVGAGVMLAARRSFPALLAGVAWYTIQVSPVLGFAQSGPQLVADRYSYASCLPFALLFGAALMKMSQSPRLRTSGGWRAALAAGVFAVFALLYQATYRQNGYWDRGVTLWTRGVEVSPLSAIARTNLGDEYAKSANLQRGGLRRELFRRAIEAYRTALELDPGDAVASSHMARVFEQTGDVEGAIAMYERTLRLGKGGQRHDMRLSRDVRHLAQLLIRTDRADKAVSRLRERATRAAHDLPTVQMLTELLSTFPDPSIRDGEEAVRWGTVLVHTRGADDPEALLMLATAQAEAGAIEQAVATAERGLSLAQAEQLDLMIGEFKRRLAKFRGGHPWHFGD